MDNPQTAEDFERLLLSSGDSSIVWVRYMAFQLQKARDVAERAVKHISFTEDKERFNVWIAYLNLEASFGSREEDVFKRAVQYNPQKKVYMQMCQIQERLSRHEKAKEWHEKTR